MAITFDTREMTLWLRALVEEPGSVPSPYMVVHKQL